MYVSIIWDSIKSADKKLEVFIIKVQSKVLVEIK